jgi:hypothetical protein
MATKKKPVSWKGEYEVIFTKYQECATQLQEANKALVGRDRVNNLNADLLSIIRKIQQALMLLNQLEGVGVDRNEPYGLKAAITEYQSTPTPKHGSTLDGLNHGLNRRW